MFDIKLLTENNFLRKRCSEPTNVAHCPECGSEFIQGADGRISCPACLTTYPTGAFYCTRCHHETGGAGERICSSIAAYEKRSSLGRPAFASNEPLWQVLTRSDSTARILEESKIRINIAAARFPPGTKILGEGDAAYSVIENVATFQDDLRRAPTPEEARLSGADYMPSFGDWTPYDEGMPTFYLELMAEVASIPSLEKFSSHLKEPSITTVENQFPLIPSGMNPSLYTLVLHFSTIRKPMPDLIDIFLGKFHPDLFRASAVTSRVFMEDMALRTKVWFKYILLRLKFNHTQWVQAEETVRVFQGQTRARKKRLEIVRVREQAASAHKDSANAALRRHALETLKSKDKFKNIFQRLVSQAQQMKFNFLENWYAEQLKTFPLNEAHIDQIGEGLKSILQDHGIHSAADVAEYMIIPGFGAGRVHALMHWKQECKDLLAHRPAPALPSTNTDAALVDQMQQCLLAAIDLKKKHLACINYAQSMNAKIARLAVDIDIARRWFRTAPAVNSTIATCTWSPPISEIKVDLPKDLNLIIREATGTWSWADAEAQARAAGNDARLPTHAEVRKYIADRGERPLFDRDVWWPVIDSPNAWVSVGNYDPRVRLGNRHENLGGPPGWGTTNQFHQFRTSMGVMVPPRI